MACRRIFTLIELLVSVAIITILFSLLMPAFSESRDKARFARWLQFNKQCSNDSACVINMNFQEGENDVLKNSAMGYYAEGFSAYDHRGIIRGDYEWARGRWAKNKKALVFDGMSTYVEFPKSKYVTFDGTSDFTIIAWVRFDLPAFDSENGIFGQCYMGTNTSGYSIYFPKDAPGVSIKNEIAAVDVGTVHATFNNMDADETKYVTIDSESWFQITLRNKIVNGNQEVDLFLDGVRLNVRSTQNIPDRANPCSAPLIIGGLCVQQSANVLNSLKPADIILNTLYANNSIGAFSALSTLTARGGNGGGNGGSNSNGNNGNANGVNNGNGGGNGNGNNGNGNGNGGSNSGGNSGNSGESSSSTVSVNYFFKGRMDEFIVYSRALNDREIENHYLMGRVSGN